MVAILNFRIAALWRIVALGLTLCCVAGSIGSSPARADYTTTARNAILMDFETRSILFEKDVDTLMPPASMSKLMTLAVVFDALKSGQIGLDDEFFTSERAWRTGGAPSGTAAMFLPINSGNKLGDLIQGITVQSGNDACIVIAEALSGSEEGFARLMTEKARKLGLKKATFKNSTGLPHPEHLMTVRELALLAHHIISTYPEYYSYFAQKEYRYRKHKFFNRNPLIFLDIGADGLKTGYTAEAGFGIVGSAVREGRRLIVVVAGAETANARRDEARKLLEYGFRSFRPVKVYSRDERVGDALVFGGAQSRVPLVGNGDISMLMPSFNVKRMDAAIVYDGPLRAPIRKGDQVAHLRVSSSQTGTNMIPLYAAEDVEEGGALARGLDALYFFAIGWLL